MQLARTRFCLLLCLGSCTSTAELEPMRADPAATATANGESVPGAVEQTADTQPSPANSPSLPDDLLDENRLIAESDAACEASDYVTARAKAAEAVTSLLAQPESDERAALQELLEWSGRSAWQAQDAHTANRAWQRLFEIRSRTLPDEHSGLQMARGLLAVSISQLGDLAGARTLQEKVLEVDSRTLPDDAPNLQASRDNLAGTLRALGDLAGAQALCQKVYDVYSRTQPDDSPKMQTARTNLAATLCQVGDIAGARALFEKVLEVHSRKLPDDHFELQVARMNLAVTLKMSGDLASARPLFEKVLEVYARILPADHPDLQRARGNLAWTIKALGDLAGARALQEQVLEFQSRRLPDDHADLQRARQNLAETLAALGDQAGARALREKVLEVRSHTLPDDHPDLQAARLNLAGTLISLGDFAGAQPLLERVFQVYSDTLPDDHPSLQAARGSLAQTLAALGDLDRARILQEQVIGVYSRAHLDDHLDLQMARRDLAETLEALGDLDGARVLEEQGLEVLVRTLPDDHPDLQQARQQLARTIASQFARSGQPAEARERCADLIGALARAQVRRAREAIVGSPAREAEERCSSLGQQLDVCLSFAAGFGAFEPVSALESESFALAETTRGAAIVSARLTRTAASVPRYAELREALRNSSAEFAELAQRGTTSAEFDRARTKRESAERELVTLARELSGGQAGGVDIDAGSVAAILEEREAAVSFRRYGRWRVDVVDEPDSTGRPAVKATKVDSLCAFVVRSSGARGEPAPPPLTLVDLGPIAPIQEAVHAWRDGLGVGTDARGLASQPREESAVRCRETGILLRERIFDPLLPALAGSQRIVVALDDVLHLVPLDSLPFDEDSLLGDHWRIETCTTLAELLRKSEGQGESGRLVVFGDVEYGAGEATVEAGVATEIASSEAGPRPAEDAGILRGSAWSAGFPALPGTGVEMRGIARSFREQFTAQDPPVLCEHAEANRERLLSLAPGARWLHIATHGWFGPESIQSWTDPAPLDEKSGLGQRPSGADQVKGMSPMLLCGVALAGANSPENASGRIRGLVTAEELSTLDLSNCELVVLSACDTNAGERRGGQGVASLQKALQMAGARSVITSSWKVPDEATKDLMLDFYRRLWVEKKTKVQALWEAKTMLRNVKDERGDPRYTTRDWAAWVLTGSPD